ncbi:MAG: FAD-dependent oxidoreductase [Gammaproteobacteria bacterium]|nr:FAD-dependent oxidoreductase [Gammaproteobacteria bacterium]
MGCSTLYHLAKEGVQDAILLERNQLTSGTTWHSAAQVRALRSSQNLTRMIQYSVDLYAQLEEQTGQQVGWIQKGSLSIATHPDRLIHIKRQEALAHAFGIKASSISASEAKERWPLMNADDVLGAVWSPDDGRVSPSDVCAALARGAKSMGGRIFERTGVTGILTERGKIVGIETTAGTVRCEAVALCAGLWSRELGAMAATPVPVVACEHFYMLTKPIPGIEGNTPTLSDHDGHLYIRDDSGGLLVGCFEPDAKPIAPGVLGAEFEFGLLNEDWEHFEPMMRHALHRLPALETAEVKMLLNGPESFTPDGMFMLGETATTRGLFLGCGMNSVGIASGGGAGMNLAHCIIHGRTAYDLSEADAKRFAPVFDSVEHLMARAPEVLGTHYEITYPGRQFISARDVREGPLTAEHRSAKARMGQFYGWERPLYFHCVDPPTLTFAQPSWHDQVGKEVMAAHQRAAVFDASTFGKIDVCGPDAEAFLQHTCASDVGRAPGRVIYTAVLSERGTYAGDITLQRLDYEHYRLFVGADAIQRDFAWFERHAHGYDVRIEDRTEDFAVLGLMGPDTERICASLGANALNALRYFECGPARIADRAVTAARMSYVGEFGWEITCTKEDAVSIYRGLLDAGAEPAGLYAQTSMRIEKAFAAMGHELDSDVSPIEAGLDKFVAENKDYVGSQALAQRRKKVRRTLATLVLEDPSAVPLGNEPVYAAERIVGRTTSAAFGFRVGAPVALAHLHFEEQAPRTVAVNIAGVHYRAALQYGPAFDPTGSRMKTSR